jgi:hypothetical protein
MAGTTAGRRLGPRGAEPAVPDDPPGQAAGSCETLAVEEEAAGTGGDGPGSAPEPAPGPEPGPAPGGGPPAPAVCPGGGAGAAGGGAGGVVPGAGRAAVEGRVRSRYAGAMLLYASFARAGAPDLLAAAAGGRPGAARLLAAAVSACFALGKATTGQFKHLRSDEAGPVAGLAVLPDLRTLRPALAAIADRADPLELQQMFAAAMLAADPVTSGVYYVDGASSPIPA